LITDNELKNIDSEDLEDFLVKVENSFDIQFVGNEIIHITTFGQLCDHIADKIQLDNTDDCTSQQAFYKLREAISSTLQLDNKTISPHFTLADLLPRKSRRSTTKKLEKHLGFKLNILRPAKWVTEILTIVLIASLFGLIFDGQIGLLGIVFSFVGLWFANKIGNELDLETVGQVAEKMARENYLKSRRNPTTFNKNEMEKVITDWFSDYFNLDKSKLSRDTIFR
jgi:hypothetical protein